MSDKFNGFSQDEIKKVSVQGNSNTAKLGLKPALRGTHGEGIRRMVEKMPAKNKQQVGKQTQLQLPTIVTEKNDNANAIVATTPNDNDATESSLDCSIMSKSIEEALFFQPPKKSRNEIETSEMQESSNNKQDIINILNQNTHKTQKANPINDSSILHLSNNNESSDSDTTNPSMACIPLNEGAAVFAQLQSARQHGSDNGNLLNTDSPYKGVTLREFETHRKMIEEQNKQKKELLYKAIEQYTQKTAAEARKIEEIKADLSKLDNDLALDVAILRKQIDMACMHFTNMEKQYMKIESQFLKAKIDLHNASEKKELLTEHLCTVIAHNEDRKAQKLSELMQKVGLTPAGEIETKEAPITNTPDK